VAKKWLWFEKLEPRRILSGLFLRFDVKKRFKKDSSSSSPSPNSIYSIFILLMSSGSSLPPALLSWLGKFSSDNEKYAEYVWYFLGSSIGFLLLLRLLRISHSKVQGPGFITSFIALWHKVSVRRETSRFHFPQKNCND
jgi:hypothetical protein